MSRYNYLLLILIIILVGWILFNQLMFSIETASDLIVKEIKYGLNVKLKRFFLRNKRYPDSVGEIEKLIRSFRINSKKIILSGFIEGNKSIPSKIIYILKTSARETFLQFTYFGCEYIKDYKKRGIIISSVYIP